MIISLEAFSVMPKQGNPVNIDPAANQGQASTTAPASAASAPAPAQAHQPPASSAPTYQAPQQSYSAPQSNYQQPMQYGSALPADLPPIVPIAALNPYQQKWTIKVSNNSPVVIILWFLIKFAGSSYTEKRCSNVAQCTR